jgi:hypothetical protein
MSIPSDRAVLLLNETEYLVPQQALISRCSVFAENRSLVAVPYAVRSRISATSFEIFVQAIEGTWIAVGDSNAEDLLLLCNEFGFADLLPRVRGFTASNILAARVLARDLLNPASFKRTYLRSFRDFGLGQKLSPRSHLCEDRTVGSQVVLTRWTLGPEDSVLSWHLPQFARQIVRPLRLNLPGVVKVLGFCVERNPHWFEGAIVTEFAPNGPLGDLLKRVRAGEIVEGFGPTEMSICIIGVAYTMALLHGRGNMHPNLTDCSVVLNDRFEPLLANVGKIKVGGRFWMNLRLVSTICQPLTEFTDPAFALEDFALSLPANVFSFAVLICLFFSDLKTEWRSRSRRRNPMGPYADGWRYPRPPGIPDTLWQLVTECWTTEPDRRPTFAAIVQRLKGSDEWLFPGTDLSKYREYIERREQEPVHEPLPKILLYSLSATLREQGLVFEPRDLSHSSPRF